MTRPIRHIHNLGPATERMLAEVDILGEADLRQLGAVAAYQRLKFRFEHRVSLNALHAMEGALTDRDWREIDRDALKRLAAGG